MQQKLNKERTAFDILITKRMGRRILVFQSLLLILLTLVFLYLMMYTTTTLKPAETTSPLSPGLHGNWLHSTEEKQSLVLEKCTVSLSHEQLSELVSLTGSGSSSKALLVMELGAAGKSLITRRLHSHVCGWVVVLPHSTKSHQFSPILNFPPDSIMLESVGATFASVPKIARSHSSVDINGRTVRTYPVFFEFKDPDVYTIKGILECKFLRISADA